MADVLKATGKEEWVVLQRKIFSRWVKQRLDSRDIALNDVVDELGGYELSELVEVLSEKTCPKKNKIKKDSKIRAQQVDGANIALNFMLKDCGVEMKLEPAAENIVDHDLGQILGLVWALMYKYMKFGDDEQQLTARESLEMWVKNQTRNYDDVKIDDFTKSFHNGKAFCALINHFESKWLDYGTVCDDGITNIKTAMDAAEKWMDVDQYITPEDVLKLDEKSMVVFISELYYAIARESRFFVAARRIHKLIIFTQENDKMKQQYKEQATDLKTHIDKMIVELNDRTIHNTMAGAREELEKFHKFQENDKAAIATNQLSLEAFYNHLAQRLSEKQRPEFNPGDDITVEALRTLVENMEKAEAEKSDHLNKELNRQIRLQQQDEQHQRICDSVNAWGTVKEEYLNLREDITTTGAATYEINKLNASNDEVNAIQSANVPALQKLSAGLESESYEKIAEVKERDSATDAMFEKFKQLADAKMLILEDHLAREQFNEKIRLWDSQHKEKHGKISVFNGAQTAYLQTKEEIDSVDKARTELSTIESHHIQIGTFQAANVPSLKELGVQLKEAKYETEYSSSKYEHCDESDAREKESDDWFTNMEALYVTKKDVLDDDFDREVYKAATLVLNDRHVTKFNQTSGWCDESDAYLQTKEEIHSVNEAQVQLARLEQYKSDQTDMGSINVPSLKHLGQSIHDRKYERLTSYVFGTPEEVKEREGKIDERFENLETQHATKLDILQDDLAREEYKAEVLLWNEKHIKASDVINEWCKEKEEYLNTKENVTSVESAQLELSRIETFREDKKDWEEHPVVNLGNLGQKILDAKYERLTSYVFETPEEVKEREGAIGQRFEGLQELYVTKKDILDDDLAREQYKAEVLLWNEKHKKNSEVINQWADGREEYLNVKEEVKSVDEANLQLSRLDTFREEKLDQEANQVASLKALGKRILDAKYERLTVYTFETPEEVTGRESDIDGRFENLQELYVKKKEILDDDLAREKFKAEVLLWNEKHIKKSKDMNAWCDKNDEYLNIKETVDSINEANIQLSRLEAFNSDKSDMADNNVPNLKALGKQITDAKYEHLTVYVFETPEEIKEREDNIDARFVKLTELHATKKDILDDDLARENFKADVLLKNDQHIKATSNLNAWCDEKEAYLDTAEDINSIDDANIQISRLDAYDQDQKVTSENNVVGLKSQGQQILDAKYERISTYQFETPEEVKEREANIDTRFNTLTEKSQTKHKVLQEALDLENKKEEHRLQFATLSGDYVRWVKTTSEDADRTHFGFSLAEVAEFEGELKSQDEQHGTTSQEKRDAAKKVFDDGAALGVTENVYTEENPDSLEKANGDLEGSLQKRRDAYGAELKTQQENDALCKSFADTVTAFQENLNSKRKEVEESVAAELEEQLAKVKSYIECKDEDSQIPEIQKVEDEIKGKGITDNIHTFLTTKDMQLMLSTFKSFLNGKCKTLEEDIERKALRGISKEQYQEIEEQFKQFDANDSGLLDKNEVKAALFSLGEDKSRKEIQEILDEFGNESKEGLEYEGFKEFMIGILGDVDTREETAGGFKLISQGDEAAIDPSRLNKYMEPEDVEFISSTAPQPDGKLDYNAWTEEVYSR